MKPSLALFCLAMTLAPAAIAVGARESRPHESLLYVGQLTDVDRVHRAFTIETASGREAFLCPDDVVVTGAGVAVGFDSLAAGQRVAVEAIRDRAMWLARSVEIVGLDGIAAQLEEPAWDTAAALTITAVDVAGRRLHVRAEAGPLFYRVTNETRIERDGAAIELEDLSVGERVMIAAEETGPGSWWARSITVVVPEPAPVGETVS